MDKTLLLFAMLLTTVATAQITVSRIKYQIETSNPKENELTLRRGETVDLQAQFLSYGSAMDIAGATVTLHATTNGMPGGTSFQVSGTAGSNGTASVRIKTDEWLPYSLTTGTWTLECSRSSTSRIMRARGVLKLAGIYYPITNSPIPVTWATNIWTAISGVQSRTNDWNSAFGWGNHALAGYLPLSGGSMNRDSTLTFSDLYLSTTLSVSGVVLLSPPFGISATINYPLNETGTVTFASREWTRIYVLTNSPEPVSGVPAIWTNMTWGASGTNSTYRMSWDVSNGTFKVEEIF